MNTNKLENPANSNPASETTGTVLLTRKRWAWYFLPAVVVTTILGAAFSWALGEAGPLLWPLSMVGLWVLWVWRFPRDGIRTRAIWASPVLPQMLSWCAFCLVLTAGVGLVDALVFGQGWHDPLKPYHLALYVPVVLLMLTGVYFIENRYFRIRQ